MFPDVMTATADDLRAQILPSDCSMPILAFTFGALELEHWSAGFLFGLLETLESQLESDYRQIER